MASSASSRRVGPLSALRDSEPALALGDTAVRHLRFTRAGVAPYLGAAPGGFTPWSDVDAIDLDIPTTWWPSPAVGDAIAPVVAGLLSGGGEEPTEVPTFPVRISTLGGGVLAYRITPHYLSGYRKKDALVSARAVTLLVARPDVRTLLADPSALLARLAHLPADTAPGD